MGCSMGRGAEDMGSQGSQGYAAPHGRDHVGGCFMGARLWG